MEILSVARGHLSTFRVSPAHRSLFNTSVKHNKVGVEAISPKKHIIKHLVNIRMRAAEYGIHDPLQRTARVDQT